MTNEKHLICMLYDVIGSINLSCQFSTATGEQLSDFFQLLIQGDNETA